MIPADKSYQLLACHYIDGQLKKLSKEINGARIADDIEYVHQSRVASRRLRAAFGIFENCFPEKILSNWRDEIRRLTKAFGPARDADVQIEFLNKAVSNLGTDKKALLPGIRRLSLRTIQCRQKQQSKVIKIVDRLESKAILADIHSEIERILFCMRDEKPDVKSEYVFQQTSEHIKNKMADLISYQKCIENSGDTKNHHQMRIASKRLRYTMEICQEPYGKKLDEAIKVVKKIQTLLGDIHDCDVWIENIDLFMKEELKRTKEYFGNEKPYYFLNKGLEYLKEERRLVRERLFRIFARYWKLVDGKNFWQALDLKLNEIQEQQKKPKIPIVEISKRNSSEKANNKNIINRGYSR